MVVNASKTKYSPKFPTGVFEIIGTRITYSRYATGKSPRVMLNVNSVRHSSGRKKMIVDGAVAIGGNGTRKTSANTSS